MNEDYNRLDVTGRGHSFVLLGGVDHGQNTRPNRIRLRRPGVENALEVGVDFRGNLLAFGRRDGTIPSFHSRGLDRQLGDSHMRCFVLIVATWALLLGGLGQAIAGTVVLSDTGRGWIRGGLFSGDNGNAPDNDYTVSQTKFVGVNNHFDFSIPTISGTVISATLTLDNNMHFGGAMGNTYHLYSLGAFGTYGFADIGIGTPYGSTTIKSTGTVTVALDAPALADIAADEGGTFSLGGVVSGVPGGAIDFSTGATTLTLEIADVPEPATLTLVAIGIAGMAGYAWRRRRYSMV
jgi:hypothetical protein